MRPTPGPRWSEIRTLAALLLLAACGAPAPRSALSHRGGDPRADGARAIDWMNRTYAVEPLGAVAVRDGRADLAFDEDNRVTSTGEPTGSYEVSPPVFADVDGDGLEDAVIVSRLATGGTGRFSEVRIYGARGGQVTELAAIPGGDRGDGGIRRVSVLGAAVLVERSVLADGDGICCASQARRERWVWRAGRIVEDEAAREAVDPGAP